MGPYVSIANPPLSDYIIQYNSQPQRTNHSFRMKAKSKCMGKHNANNHLSMWPLWQMSLAGIWKHFTSNRLVDRIIRSLFFFLSAVFRLWELTFGITTALRPRQPGALTKTIMEPKLLTRKNMTLTGCASVFSWGDVCTAWTDTSERIVSYHWH